jgi:hypothetical protein
MPDFVLDHNQQWLDHFTRQASSKGSRYLDPDAAVVLEAKKNQGR